MDSHCIRCGSVKLGYDSCPACGVTSERDTAEPGAGSPHEALGSVIGLAPVRPGVDGGRCPQLGFDYDTRTWAPMVDGSDNDSLLAAVFMPTKYEVRGTSTLVLDGRRLVGVCFEGKSAKGDFSPEQGRMVAWELVLDGVHYDVEELRPGSPCLVVRSATDGSEIIRIARLRRRATGAAPTAVAVEWLVGRLVDAVGSVDRYATGTGTVRDSVSRRSNHGPVTAVPARASKTTRAKEHKWVGDADVGGGVSLSRFLNSAVYVIAGISFMVFAGKVEGGMTPGAAALGLAFLAYGIKIFVTRSSYWVSAIVYFVAVLGVAAAFGGLE